MSARDDRMGGLRPGLFAGGCLCLLVGVVLHLMMFLPDLAAARHLMGMPFDRMMTAGMALIAAGTVLAGVALWRCTDGVAGSYRIVAPNRLLARHWMLTAVLVFVLVIDTMKPATLGFVVPGMSTEYGLPRNAVAWLPLSALAGTVAGSVLWGWFADRQGRRAAILLSTLMFVGTSICGAMPSLGWNIAMCFFMGASAGGLLPVAYALLTEMLPTMRRGAFLVMVGGLGSAGGYFAASGFAAVLEPIFGWRALWLIGLPTGLLVVLCGLWLPESPFYLARTGRIAAAERQAARYGGRLVSDREDGPAAGDAGEMPMFGRYTLPLLVAAGLVWGFANFGFVLWLPAMLKAEGLNVGQSGALLASASLLAFLTIIPATILYQRLGGARALIVALTVTAAGMVAIAVAGVFAAAVLMVLIGTNATIAMLLPLAAEGTTARFRGRGTGIAAAASKAGGLGAQIATLLGFVPAARGAATAVAIPLLILIVLLLRSVPRAGRPAGAAVA